MSTGFKPKGMVPWFHPIEIGRTAARAFLAKVVTGYADPRGTMGADKRSRIEPAKVLPHAVADILDLREDQNGDQRKEIWFDYLADTGEGFDSTFAMACVLSTKNLQVEGVEEKDNPLPRGEVLVLGGDQVYPSPSRKEYADRFVQPFSRAFPQLPAH